MLSITFGLALIDPWCDFSLAFNFEYPQKTWNTSDHRLAFRVQNIEQNNTSWMWGSLHFPRWPRQFNMHGQVFRCWLVYCTRLNSSWLLQQESYTLLQVLVSMPRVTFRNWFPHGWFIELCMDGLEICHENMYQETQQGYCRGHQSKSLQRAACSSSMMCTWIVVHYNLRLARTICAAQTGALFLFEKFCALLVGQTMDVMTKDNFCLSGFPQDDVTF